MEETKMENAHETEKLLSLPVVYLKEHFVIEDANENEVANLWTADFEDDVIHRNATLICESLNTREARQQRIEELEKILKNLCDDLDQVAKDSFGIFQLAAVHGMPYTGKSWKSSLSAARSVLKGGK